MNCGDCAYYQFSDNPDYYGFCNHPDYPGEDNPRNYCTGYKERKNSYATKENEKTVFKKVI